MTAPGPGWDHGTVVVLRGPILRVSPSIRAGILVLALTALPAAASAQTYGFNWDTCAPANGAALQTFACDTNDGASFDLVMAMDPFTPMPNATGANSRIWFRTEAAALPSWWQVLPGDCRAGAIAGDATAPFPAGCADAWLGQATVTVSFSTLLCDPQLLIMDVFARLPPGVTRSLVPGTRYVMYRLRISREATTGAGSCAGCPASGCFGTYGLFVSNSDGLGWSMSGGNNFARWQGQYACSGPSCGPTPVRTSTWGAIHSLYR